MKLSKPKLVCVCGTTASGKTDLAISIAQFLGSEVLCFDSAQVFRHADIGSAKVTSEDRRKVPHQLLDLFEPSEKVQAGAFLDLAANQIQRLSAEKKIPVLCVGTSLYFRLLLEGIAETGEAAPQVRVALEKENTQELYQKLQATDPKRASELHLNDRLRIIRALEIFMTTGKTASELYAEQKRQIEYDVLLLILVWPREKLAERIQQRTTLMLEAGLIEEVKFLHENYGPDIQIFDSIGYQESLEFLEGGKSIQDLEQSISLHTRQLAKRQLTFWRSFPRKLGFKLLPEQDFSLLAGKNNERQIMTLDLSLTALQSEIDGFLEQENGSKAIYINAQTL